MQDMTFQMKRITSLLVAMMLHTAPSLAQEWYHASAPMGQYEGGIILDGGRYGVSYGCAGSFGNLAFYAEGVRVAAGEGVIRVDGREVASGNVSYDSIPNQTKFNVDVRYEWGPSRWTSYNSLISALASGSEAVWTSPNGEDFVFPLAGSVRIRSCLMQ